MPMFRYWTILIGAEPTAFRAKDAEELIPTLRQLQRTQPTAVMKWCESGRLWDSPESAQAERDARAAEWRSRDRQWRPGGEHRDPRDRFKVPREVKKRRIVDKLRDEGRLGQPGSHARSRRPPDRGPRKPRTPK
jgi:hypothetical protein